MSNRPFQPPEVIRPHDGVSHLMSTPSRLAISVATSMSKPSYWPVSSFSDDCGGYAGSVETVISPFSHTCARRSSPVVSTDAHTVSPEGDAPAPAVPSPLSLPQAASPRLRTAPRPTRTEIRKRDDM